MNELVLKTDEIIEPSMAESIKAVFVPFVEKLTSLESDYNEVIKQDASKETCNKARRLRLDIVKIRTATENARKAQKETYLRSGRAVDGFANIVKFAIVPMEEKLEEIEKHFERLEAERIEKLANERADELAAFCNLLTLSPSMPLPWNLAFQT